MKFNVSVLSGEDQGKFRYRSICPGYLGVNFNMYLAKLALVFSLLLPSLALACSCAPPKAFEEDIPKLIEGNSDVVVALAKVLSVEKLKDDSNTHITSFEVIENFTAFDRKLFKTKVANACCLCGVKFDIGTTYLVYAHKTNGGYFQTNSCSRTKDAKQAKEELEFIRNYKVNKQSHGNSNTSLNFVRKNARTKYSFGFVPML
ncbi:MAG: hypothetical protein ABW116_10955 [Candidatus Sedimenticola sp. 20ELBAFRAG]